MDVCKKDPGYLTQLQWQKVHTFLRVTPWMALRFINPVDPWPWFLTYTVLQRESFTGTYFHEITGITFRMIFHDSYFHMNRLRLSSCV